MLLYLEPVRFARLRCELVIDLGEKQTTEILEDVIVFGRSAPKLVVQVTLEALERRREGRLQVAGGLQGRRTAAPCGLLRRLDSQHAVEEPCLFALPQGAR